MADHIIRAKCVDKSFDSTNAFNYLPGDLCEFNVTTGKVTVGGSNGSTTLGFDRQLFWLKTLGGRWAFDFDRANSSSTADRIFFCKECGQPFDRLSDIGNHASSVHEAKKPKVSKEQAAIMDDEEEEGLLAQRRAEEAETQQATT